MSNQSDSVDNHYNDDDEHHFGVALTTYRDGVVTTSGECCACKLHDPRFVEHMSTVPKGMYVTFLAIPTMVQ